jgi:phage-related protein
LAEERRRRGARTPTAEEELVKLIEYFETLRSEISEVIGTAVEPIQRTIMPLAEPMSFMIDDSVQRATAPATEPIIKLLPTLVPTLIDSLNQSLSKMPEVSYSACTSFIPDVCSTQCGELVAVSPELLSECYKKCEGNIRELCRAGTESVKAFIETQLKRIRSMVEGIASFAPIVTADVPQIMDSTAITVRRR